jgi:hypothetical protein
MANVKISDLTAYVDPSSSDILPIVDLVNDVTKKVTIADLLENAGDGSAAAPAFAFNSDSNTGIYKSGADELSFATGGTQRLLIDASGNTTVQGNLTVSGTIPGYTPRTSATGSSNLSVGTTAQRDSSPAAGMIRYNSTLSQFEGYGSAWGSIGGGATGGGSDTWAVEHDNTITTSYTIGAGKNVISAGPLTVNSGATITVPSGSNWVIV